MKARCLTFLFSILIISTVAQEDLLSTWQDDRLPDSTRLNALHSLASGFLNSDPDSTLALADMLYRFGEMKGTELEKARALLLKGRACDLKGEYEQASTNFNSGIEIISGHEDRDLLAKALTYVAQLHLNQLQYDSAYHFLDRSYGIYQELSDSIAMANVLQRKAYTAQNSAEYAEAMDYAFQAMGIWEASENESGIAETNVILGDILYYQGKYVESIEYGKKALEIMERLDDLEGVANANREIGESYLILEEYDLALAHMNKAFAIKEELDTPPIDMASLSNSRGNIYKYLKQFDYALADYERSLAICKELDFDLGVMATLANVGHVHLLKEEYEQALPYLIESVEMMETSDHRMNLVENYGHMTTVHEGLGNFEEALKWSKKYNTTKDSLFTEEKDRTLSELRTQYETEKKEEQIVALEKEAQLKEQARQRDKQIRILLIVLAVLLVLLAIGLWNRLTFTRKSRAIIQKEKDRSEHLLLNILPEEVAEELKDKGEADAKLFEQTTVLFTDFKGFTSISEQLSPAELVNEINVCFKAFDHIMEDYGIEKIKTIGDAYMAAGGLHVPRTSEPKDVVNAGLEMQAFMKARTAERDAEGLPAFEMRVGIHTGPVVAGIVGVKKFQYDIWGDTVNTASRMESSGEVGQVNISEATYELVKDRSEFEFTSRGKVAAKGKGQLEMYFVFHAQVITA